MQRPIMNPTFLEDAHPAPPPSGVWRKVGRLLYRIGKLLLSDVLRRRSPLRVEIGNPFSRFVRGLFYRVMFVPVVLAVMVAVWVVTGTHPDRLPVSLDPASAGIYYDPVDLLSTDNTRIEGWLVPVVDARRVLAEGDELLHRRYPAVVLAHDFGGTRQQMLPLIAPLHDAGYVVLAINLRGNAARSAASTFGINEAQDIRAAVEMLRRRRYVDPNAIGVLGIGTGATAALLTAQQDARLHVLVLDHPIRQFEDVLGDRIGPRQPWMSWMKPMCKWGFEIAYKVNADDVDLDRFALMMQSAPVLMLDDPSEYASCLKPSRQKQLVDFLKKHLVARSPGTTTLVRTDQADADKPASATSAREEGDNQVWPRQRTAREMLQQSGLKTD